MSSTVDAGDPIGLGQKLGLSPGMVVQELGWDTDADDDVRMSIAPSLSAPWPDLTLLSPQATVANQYRDAFAVDGEFAGMEALKFQQLVRPGTELQADLDWRPGLLAFRVGGVGAGTLGREVESVPRVGGGGDPKAAITVASNEPAPE